MPNLKQIKSRINTVSDICKTTKAMQLIAATKLHGLKSRIHAAKLFYKYSKEALVRCLNYYQYNDLEGSGPIEELLLDYNKKANKKVLLLAISSDQGLCGAFNNQLFKFTDEEIEELKEASYQFKIVTLGKKAYEFFSRKSEAGQLENCADLPKDLAVKTEVVTNSLLEKIVNNGYTEIIICANHFKNMVSQECSKTKAFCQIVKEYNIKNQSYILQGDGLLEDTFRLYLYSLIYYNILLSKVGEESSRVLSMDNASRNANKIIDSLTLTMNRARQAMVTKELIEITTSAELL